MTLKIPFKICSKCKKRLPSTTEYFHKQTIQKSGLRPDCKECRKKLAQIPEIKEKTRKYQREYQKKHYHERKKYNRNLHLEKTYNINTDKYNIILESQNYRCKICGKKAEENNYGKLYIDHNHKTAEIRGLLCQKCNSVLGFISDNGFILIKMIKYLYKDKNHLQ